MQLVDTHCHLDFHQFDTDRDEVVRRAVKNGVVRILVPGIDLETSRQAVALADCYEAVYAAVGVHPNDIAPEDGILADVVQELGELARHPKVVAVGEIGLDYYWHKHPPPLQQRWMSRQVELAASLELPVIVHNREATVDVLGILAGWHRRGLPGRLANRPGVLHSFSGTWEDAQTALEMGFYLGFTGPITYKKADEMRYVAMNAPIERILIETDAPFLAPHPMRGRRNEPAYVRIIAEKLAEVRDIALEQVAGQTTHNAATLFGWNLT